MSNDMNNNKNDDTHNDMTDELKKLAKELQNISPSPSARQLGMSAAIAAFQKEFEVEAVSETQADLEKIQPPPKDRQRRCVLQSRPHALGVCKVLGAVLWAQLNHVFRSIQKPP